MQETSVGWDPVIEPRHLPLSVRLYVLFVFLVIVLCLIRATLIAWNLWFRPLRLTRTDLSGPEKIKQCAHAWLRGIRLDIDPLLRTHVITNFNFLTSILKSELRSLRRIAVAMALFGFGLLGIQTIDLLQHFSVQKVIPLGVLSGSMSEVLASPTAGFVAAGAVYLISGVLESRLARREANFRLSIDQTSPTD